VSTYDPDTKGMRRETTYQPKLITLPRKYIILKQFKFPIL